MRRRIFYVLGGPSQPELETKKQHGEQPLSEFNVFVERNDAQLVTTDQFGGGHALSLQRRLVLANALRRRASEYDIIITSGEDIGIPVALASMMLRTPKPVWIILHGSYLQGRKFSAIAPLLRRARHVQFLCLSESLRTMMIKQHGFPAERCHNAGYGVDTSFFQPRFTDHPALIVSAGSANRDYQTLVSAVDGLEVPLRIAADSLWRPTESGLTAEKLPGYVTAASAGSYTGLRSLYSDASIVVVPLHPARYACGYAVIAEAMAMGKVVITTRTEAPSDLIVDGVTGFQVEPGDVPGLKGVIRLLLDEPQRALAMGALGAVRMQQNFSLTAYCARIEQIIEERSDVGRITPCLTSEAHSFAVEVF